MYKIAVTGADVSGKTQSWEQLNPALKVKIQQVPEIATALMTHVLPALARDIEVTIERLATYQSVFRPTQLAAEDNWSIVAAAAGKRLVWCDRGIPDMVAYEPGGWPVVEAAFGMTKAEIYARYDFVIVLRSLATINPERFLAEMEKNPARAKRTVEETVALDERTFAAWADHPGLVQIDCTRGFESVVRQVEDFIRRLVGKEVERKFVLPAGLPDFSQFDQMVRVFQGQGYLVNSEEAELRLRRNEVENGPITHVITTKSSGTLVRDEHEDEHYPDWAFNALWPNIQDSPIRKIRHLCQAGTLYEVDLYQEPASQVVVEISFTSIAAAAAFVRPSWMANAIEVTDDKGFKAKNVAKNGCFPALELVTV